jgi:Skp family chaperone for outer membrane proteins
VKRTVVILAGAAALAIGGYLASRLWAQTGSQPYSAPAQSRIALVNLNQVFKEYHKSEALQKQSKAIYERWEGTLKGYTSSAEGLQKKAQETTIPAAREEIAAQLKDLKRKYEDATAARDKEMEKNMETTTQTLFGDLKTAVQQVARSHGLELVMQYNDAITPAEQNNPMLIRSRMTQLACMPLYNVSSIDITDQVTSWLNSSYDRGGAAH